MLSHTRGITLPQKFLLVCAENGGVKVSAIRGHDFAARANDSAIHMANLELDLSKP
jgi:hypothetical protein